MIRIVSDTDSSLPQEIADEYDIPLIPMHIIFGDEVVRERYDISDADSYARMSAAPRLPTTSQPPVGAFKEVYESILSKDPNATILSIHLSASMSGTFESARQAAEMFPGADIRPFDTRSVSLGQGLMVFQAARLVRQGANVDQVMATLEAMRDGMQVYFALHTLEYLARGGRIGRASHLMGNLLDIKPILKVTDGVVDAHSRQRTWRRAVETIRDIAIKNSCDAAGKPKPGLLVGVAHAVSQAEAQRVADDLRDALSPEVLLLCEIGPGLGVHTGPGALGVCWYVPPD